MITHWNQNFLNDVAQYKASEEYWEACWLKNGFGDDRDLGWTYPWISTGSLDCLDGNPIFSAFSPRLRRGVRIIQHEPTSSEVEIQAWPDFVGENDHDPESIAELVISCALSEGAAALAMSLIRPWVEGRSISFEMPGSGLTEGSQEDERNQRIHHRKMV